MAYAIDDKVFVHTEWASLKYSIDQKPKTIILLDENYKALGFGKDAKHTYVSPINSKNGIDPHKFQQLYVSTNDER